ncbi:MAG: hypothetical protein MRZ79_06315 [Bacteroidia bacterium]|nr:hypothetical protein [Bacteroidia bacterium]
MKNLMIALMGLAILCPNFSLGQNNVGWFFTPEFSLMAMDQHLGRAVGFQGGVSLAQRRLNVGIFYYGRSGPINPHEVSFTLPGNQTYKGKGTIDFRADHGAFGVMISPQVELGNVKLDVPLLFGQFGAGFYLTGDDRITPDGRRVSDWEDDLLGNADAGFGFILEGGIRARTAINKNKGIEAGIGVHYTHTIGYESTLGGTAYYRVPRFSIFFLLGN